MINLVGSGKTICPYYVREGKFSIVCMGSDERMKEVAVFFPNKEQKRSYQEDFCFCKCYIGCPVAESAQMRAEEECKREG